MYGTSNPAYNGFDAHLDALADGQIGVQAAFDDGTSGSYDYQPRHPAGRAAIPSITGGPTQTVDVSQADRRGQLPSYVQQSRTTCRNPGAAVFLTATISWP